MFSFLDYNTFFKKQNKKKNNKDIVNTSVCQAISS